MKFPDNAIADSELDRLEGLARKATPGPWRPCGANDQGHGKGCACGLVWSEPVDMTLAITHAVQDSEEIRGEVNDNTRFIAEARTAVPALIAEVRRLRTTEWARGVEDSIRIVENRLRMLTMFDKDPQAGIKSRPAAVAMLDEVLVFLRGMHARGTYEGPFSTFTD